MQYQTFVLDDMSSLAESVQVEFKLAAGRDGLGKVPEDMWESYSAFANTIGGEIILGVREEQGVFTLEGIPQPDPMIEYLWQHLNDKSKVSINILQPTDIQLIRLVDKHVIRIRVPQAEIHQRPVFIGTDAYSGCYLRVDEADMHASRRQVSQMMRRAREALSGQ
ncbi:ATP-binding protein [Shewanella submarina]|uniref:Helix-turn-helix domain-containing protein n=1 Tax=Shewanella submarina TaxID=2016376 RepID=A0ABV7GI53_9GAMM|nr:ATP-binding protein [Shewanella submarina]MCL1035554.1 ATP-binding protein [Shewanella submarina]